MANPKSLWRKYLFAVVGVLAIGLPGLSASDQGNEPVTLRLGGKAGETYNLVGTVDATMEVSSFESISDHFEISAQAKYKFAVTLDELKPNGNTVWAMRVVSKERRFKRDGREVNLSNIQNLNWQDAVLIFENTPTGRMIEMWVESDDPAVKHAVEYVFESLSISNLTVAVLPEKPVVPGDTWPGGEMSLDLQEAGSASFQQEMTLEKISEQDGEKIARIAIKHTEVSLQQAKDSKTESRLKEGKLTGFLIYSFKKQRVVIRDFTAEVIYLARFPREGAARLKMTAHFQFKEE